MILGTFAENSSLNRTTSVTKDMATVSDYPR